MSKYHPIFICPNCKGPQPFEQVHQRTGNFDSMYMVCLGCLRTGATDTPGGTTLGAGDNKLTFVMGDTGLGLHGHCHGSAISVENCVENCGDLHYECPEYQSEARRRCFTHPDEHGFDKCRMCHNEKECDAAVDRFNRCHEDPFRAPKYCEKCFKKKTGHSLPFIGWDLEDDEEPNSTGMVRMDEIGIMQSACSSTSYYSIVYECPVCGHAEREHIDSGDGREMMLGNLSFNEYEWPLRNRNGAVFGFGDHNKFSGVRVGVDSLNSVTDIIKIYRESGMVGHDKAATALYVHYCHLKLDMLNVLEKRAEAGDGDAKDALDAFKLDCYYRGVKYSEDKRSLYVYSSNFDADDE